MEDKFFNDIAGFMNTHSLSVMDAILHWLDINNVEIESVTSVIKKNENVMLRLQEEAEKLNMIKKTETSATLF